MLKRLKIENFKAWREADLTLGKVTGLFGTNSAGKSSLLQFLLLLKQTRNATDRGLILDFGGPADLVNLGTFKDVVHGRNDKAEIRWSLDWTLPKPLSIEDPMNPQGQPLFEDDSLKMECEVGWEEKRLLSHRLTYEFDDVRFSWQPSSDPKKGFELLATDSQEFVFKHSQGRRPALPHAVKTYLFPSQARSYYQNSDFLVDFELAYENLMDTLYYLGPLREYPRREYHWAGASPNDVGQRGERTVDAILAATRDSEKRRLTPGKGRGGQKSFEAIIAYWLQKLGLIHEFNLKEIAKGTNLYRVMVKTSRQSAETPLTDVGFGVSQILPALVLLYYVPEGSMVLMEQPEIHLHPAVQSGLADIMLSVAKVRNVQIIVESHSEHLMRRLQRRVAEQKISFEDVNISPKDVKISSEDVKLYFISSEEGNKRRAGSAQAKISDLCLNEWGEIEEWPPNFFGDEVGEIAAIIEASLDRKMGKSK